MVNLYNNTHINSDISNYGTLHLASQDETATRSKITGNMDNHGLIYLASNPHSVGNQLIIDGNYTGYQGSQIHMNSLLSDDKSSVDSLIITGDSTGKSAVYVTELGGHGAQTVEGIRVIEVQGNSGAEFTQGGRIVAGHSNWKSSGSQLSTQSNRYIVQMGGMLPSGALTVRTA